MIIFLIEIKASLTGGTSSTFDSDSGFADMLENTPSVEWVIGTVWWAGCCAAGLRVKRDWVSWAGNSWWNSVWFRCSSSSSSSSSLMLNVSSRSVRCGLLCAVSLSSSSLGTYVVVKWINYALSRTWPVYTYLLVVIIKGHRV